MDQEMEIPSYFLCPISLDIMKDPVTVPTGITYDRDSIERWIYSSKNATCPVTKQPLSVDSDMELTPNHTLRRLIQSWCTLNAVDRIPTPKPPVSRAHLTKLFSRAHRHLLPSLRQLQSLALESAANRRALESAGAVGFLSSVVISHHKGAGADVEDEEVNASVDLAVSVLAKLHISELGFLAFQNDCVLVDSLTRIINRSGTDEALTLLKSVLDVAQPIQLARLRPELFSGLVHVLKEDHQTLTKSTTAALKTLIHVLPWGRNRVKAVEAGAVGAAVELLLAGDGGRRVAEMAVVVVEMLCGCAEGRAELAGHGGGLAVVSKRILRVSRLATERGVRALWAVAKYSGEAAVVREMAEVGVVAKMCLVVQVDVDGKTRERAKEILKLHAAAWKGSPCVPTNLDRSSA